MSVRSLQKKLEEFKAAHVGVVARWTGIHAIAAKQGGLNEEQEARKEALRIEYEEYKAKKEEMEGEIQAAKEKERQEKALRKQQDRDLEKSQRADGGYFSKYSRDPRTEENPDWRRA